MRRDEGVHSGRVGFEDPFTFGVITRPFTIVHRASVPEQPGLTVAPDRLRAEDLGHAAFLVAAPQLHLPQPVLRHDVPLRKKQVVRVLRVDVRNAPSVANHLHRLAQSLQALLPIKRGQRGTGQLAQFGVGRLLRARPDCEENENGDNPGKGTGDGGFQSRHARKLT